MLSGHKCSINKFLRFLGKDLVNVAKSDVMSFYEQIDRDYSLTLESKKAEFGRVKTFLKWFLNKFEDEIATSLEEQLRVMKMLNFLTEDSNFEFNTHEQKQVENDYKSVFMTMDQLEQVLDYFKEDYQKYLMFRVLAESGMRKGELLSIDVISREKVNGRQVLIEEDLKNRCLRVKGKTGLHNYPIGKDLAFKLLNFYYTTRKNNKKAICNAFFVSMFGTRFTESPLNHNLTKALKFLGLWNKNEQGKGVNNITIHCFRRSLNSFRKKEMNCPNDVAKLLVNHKVNEKDQVITKTGDVNNDHYTKKKTWNQILELFDKYNPYSNTKL
jgi:integrase